MLYENNFLQLHNKNTTTNVWFYSCLQLLSVIHSFVSGNRHLFSKNPAKVL